jgi:hypothetical protein
MKTITVDKARYEDVMRQKKIREVIKRELKLDRDPGTHRASVLFGVPPSMVSESQRQATRRTLSKIGEVGSSWLK